MYLRQIEQLVILQKVDNEILILEKLLEDTPKEVAELQFAFAEVKDSREQLEEKLELLNAQKTRVETEIEEDGLKIKKSKNKLMMVGNSREYHAMMRELENMEKLNRSREEEKVALDEELTRQSVILKEIEQKASDLEKLLNEKQAELERLHKESKQRLGELGNKRKIAIKTIPKPIMGRYDFIRSRIPNPVIVSVSKGVCGGCFISIPPQSFNELQKGQQILSCPNCQRLIYWEEHFKPEEEAAPAHQGR